MPDSELTPAQKAARTRKRKAAARKAAITRKRRAAARKAADKRKAEASILGLLSLAVSEDL